MWYLPVYLLTYGVEVLGVCHSLVFTCVFVDLWCRSSKSLSVTIWYLSVYLLTYGVEVLGVCLSQSGIYLCIC